MLHEYTELIYFSSAVKGSRDAETLLQKASVFDSVERVASLNASFLQHAAQGTVWKQNSDEMEKENILWAQLGEGLCKLKIVVEFLLVPNIRSLGKTGDQRGQYK